MKEIKITTDSKNYPVLVGTEILTERNFEEFSEREILLVIDSNINSAIKESVKESLNKISSNFIHITIEASEKNKSMITINHYLKILLSKNCRFSKLKKNRPKVVIGFAAETENILENAKSKLKKKGCDFIVANDVSLGTETMGGDNNTAIIVSEDDAETLPKMSKRALAKILVGKISQSFEELDA